MIKFNHNNASLCAALGIEKKRENELSAIVLFELINQQALLHKLYDNPQEAPLELRTKSGLLEKLLRECQSESEAIFVTHDFTKIDILTDHDKKVQSSMQGVVMLYTLMNGNREEFIKRYNEQRSRIEDALQNGETLPGMEDDE